MPLTVKWKDGISVEHEKTRILLDPQVRPPAASDVFVTHAHYDHSRAFNYPRPRKHSTQETRDLLKTYGKKIVNWRPVYLGQGLRMGGMRVLAHNAGHILGSSQYEVVAPEGRMVYTGDINFVDTATTSAAEPVECDVLIIESTFGLPSFVFPPKDQVALDMVKWAVNSIKRGKIPAFRTDALGNAQEIIRIFNDLTTLPVTTHRRVTGINRVYKAHGYKLDYLDIQSEEANEVASSGECVFVAPKGFNLSERPRFNAAFVSGWALWSRGGKKAFPLSDHADFPHLLKFVEACKPKTVLTCHGGRFNNAFAKQVTKRLGIEARPLGLIPTTLT